MSVSAPTPSSDPNILSASNHTIIPPESTQEPSKKEPLHIPKLAIVLIVIYALGLYGFVGYLILTKKQSEPLTTVNTNVAPPQLPELMTDTTSSKSATSLFAKELAKLRVIDFSTRWEDWYTPEATTQAQYVHMVIPKEIIDDVSAYRFNQFTYIAPKNWVGDADANTQFGTTSRLFPTNDLSEEGPMLKTFVSSQSPKEGLRVASQFFPWIREHEKELGVEGELLPIAEVATISAITPHLLTYSKIAYDIYEVFGVIFCNVEDHVADKQWETIKYEIQLLRKDRAFAEQLVATFIDQLNLKNR